MLSMVTVVMLMCLNVVNTLPVLLFQIFYPKWVK